MAGPANDRFGGDSVARSTSWEPLVRGGANFKTRDLVVARPDRLEFRASITARVFGGAFLAMGLGVIALGIIDPHWMPVLFGLVFAGAGVALLYFGATPVVFDKRQRAFWRGRTEPNAAINRAMLKHYTELKAIHALQIIRERVRGQKRSYWSYELNLVLEDGGRINVTDHGDYPTLRRNADTLSAFLERPLWDAVAEA